MTIPNEEFIEGLLRLAPAPQAPGGLKTKLLGQARSAAAAPVRAAAPSAPALSRPSGWIRRWWPALAPAGVTLACAAVLTVQQVHMRDLRQEIQKLTTAAAAQNASARTPSDVNASSQDAAAGEAREISQLQDEADKLGAEIGQLEKLRLENQALRSQLGASRAAPTPEEVAGMEEMEKARERAMRIACANNMKQLGLAARIWAGDNNDIYPVNIIDMTNEMNTPKILHCPADTGRPVALSFDSYTSANCSYEYLAPGGTYTEPNRVLFRCPIHGNIGLCDGSVQMEIGKTHPEWLVTRDGKLYLELPPDYNNRPQSPEGNGP